jgi:hypothetical protein
MNPIISSPIDTTRFGIAADADNGAIGRTCPNNAQTTDARTQEGPGEDPKPAHSVSSGIPARMVLCPLKTGPFEAGVFG